MGYRNAGDILPKEIIALIQQYVDGENIYALVGQAILVRQLRSGHSHGVILIDQFIPMGKFLSDSGLRTPFLAVFRAPGNVDILPVHILLYQRNNLFDLQKQRV